MTSRTVILAAALALAGTRPAHAAGDKQAALIHLEAGPKVKPAELDPLERALAADLEDLGWTVVWAEPAVTNLAIGVDPKRCADAGCRQKLAQALDAKLVAGGRIDRRKDPVLGNVVDLGVWLMDPDEGKTIGEAVEHCSKCSASDVEAAWLRALRAAEEQAGFVERRRAPPAAAAVAPIPGAASGDGDFLTAPTEESESSGGEPGDPFAGSSGIRGLFDRRMLKWYAGGAGVVLGAVGSAYILIDGPRYLSCSRESGCTTGKDRQPEQYRTFWRGVGMVAGGTVLVGGAIYLAYLEHKHHWGEGDVAIVPSATGETASIHAVITW